MTYELNLTSTEPKEWACDYYRGYKGYSVHIDNGVWPDEVGFPAFTHEQMLECQRIQNALIEKYDPTNESFGKLTYDEDTRTWSESYYDGVWDTIEPITVDGVELYALGSDWPWGEFDPEHADEYELV